MSEYRTKELDYDTRRQPKTDRFCVKCQKDIKPGSSARIVHLIDGGVAILHPADEWKYSGDSGDQGAWLLGIDCARTVGMEWSVPADAHAKHTKGEGMIDTQATRCRIKSGWEDAGREGLALHRVEHAER